LKRAETCHFSTRQIRVPSRLGLSPPAPSVREAHAVSADVGRSPISSAP
jgi:hypothetical protein